MNLASNLLPQNEQVSEESSQNSSSQSESESKSQDSQQKSVKSQKNKKKEEEIRKLSDQLQKLAEQQNEVSSTNKVELKQYKDGEHDNKDVEDKNEMKQGNPAKIEPGYKMFVIDETTADYDYIKGQFTDDEIKEAFNTLDNNKDGIITHEDLAFFLEYIGEKPTEEEIEEMIKMCDDDGNGEVTYAEFSKLASGKSLAPIGQAFPPTQEMIEQRNHLQTLWKGQQELESPFKQGKKKGQQQQQLLKLQEIQKTSTPDLMDQKRKRPDQVITNNKSSLMMQQSQQSNKVKKNNQVKQENPNKSQNQQSEILQATNNGLQNTQNNNYLDEFDQEQGQSKLLQQPQILQKIMQDKKKYLQLYCQTYLSDRNKLQRIFEQYLHNSLQDYIGYEDFYLFLEGTDNKYYKEMFQVLTKDQGQKLSLVDFMIQLISVSNLHPKDKWSMIFQVFKTENLKNEDIFKVYKNTMFKIDAPEKNIKDKIMIVRNRPNCKLKNTDKEVIDKDMFDDLVKSFPTYFSF